MQNHQRIKPTDSGSPSQESSSLYQMMLLQQQQDASFRLRLGGNLHGHPSLSGLRDFSIGNSFGYPSAIPSAIDISRQQLLQSIIAAEEQEFQQGRFAMQEYLARQQREHLAMQQLAQRESSLYPETQQHQQLRPQEFPKSNIQMYTDELNEKKRPYEEINKREEYPEAKAALDPASISCQKAKKEGEEEAQVPNPPSKRLKPAPKKKAKKNPKTEDATPAPEPKKDTKWLLMLEELKEYKATNGNCIVPRGFSPNPRLASWVAEQR